MNLDFYSYRRGFGLEYHSEKYCQYCDCCSEHSGTHHLLFIKCPRTREEGEDLIRDKWEYTFLASMAFKKRVLNQLKSVRKRVTY